MAKTRSVPAISPVRVQDRPASRETSSLVGDEGEPGRGESALLTAIARERVSKGSMPIACTSTSRPLPA
jgi:hypothetical protein